MTGLALELVGAIAHLFVGIICSSFDHIISCIICAECDLDINILEKFCNFFLILGLCYVKCIHCLWLEGVLLCEGGKDSFLIIASRVLRILNRGM